MHRVLAIAAVLVSQAPPVGATSWLCHLSADLLRLVCIAEPNLEAAALPVATRAETQAGGAAVTAVVNGTRFPLDGERMWFVDLWSPPTEFAFVEQLARATICFRSPRCTVTVLPLRR